MTETPLRPSPRHHLEEGLAVTCMALLVLITMGNVVSRYITEQSFAWTEEVSVFLMILMTMAGASAAVGRDRHMRIEYFFEDGNGQPKRGLGMFGALVSSLFFVFLAMLFARLVFDDLQYGETSQGLGVPKWWYSIWMPALCLVLALRAFGLFLRYKALK